MDPLDTKAHHFKLGLFVVCAIALATVVVVLLGAGEFLQPHIYLETYFDESVQGLAVGSPMKYLGVNKGTVEEIDTVENQYGIDLDKELGELYSRYVYEVHNGGFEITRISRLLGLFVNG